MTRKVSIGITSDYYKDGDFILPGPGLTLLDAINNVQYTPVPAIAEQGSKNSLIRAEQVKGFDMVASIAPKWDASSFIGNDQFISVHRHGAGFDMVTVPELTEANVLLCTTPQAVTRPMAVVILTYLLLLSTRYPVKNAIAQEGRWGDIPKYPGYGLVGKTFGSIGAGRIAREAFNIATPLNMSHIAYDPFLEKGALDDIGVDLVDMETVLKESDYLSIACPLNDNTQKLVSKKELNMMKPSAFLINVARGPIVDEAALITALQTGVIQGAGIDVFEQEPPSIDNPLLHMENVTCTPHALGWTDQSVIDIWAQIIDQISCIMRGEKPSGIINSEVWDQPGFQRKLDRFLSQTSII